MTCAAQMEGSVEGGKQRILGSLECEKFVMVKPKVLNEKYTKRACLETRGTKKCIKTWQCWWGR